jgi:hypothetical protein
MSNYLVAYVIKAVEDQFNIEYIEEYKIFSDRDNNKKEAKEFYKKLLAEDFSELMIPKTDRHLSLWNANICKIIKSTDL